MTQMRSVGVRGIVGGLLAIGAVRWLYGRLQPRRPSAADLLAMSDADFASFIRKRGLRTVSDATIVAERH